MGTPMPVYGPAEPYEAEAVQPATHAQAEVEAEQSARPDGAVRVRLGGDDGIDLWVPDRRGWRSSAMTALREGDFQGWADRTLTEEDAIAWEDYDPTLAEIDDFFGDRLAAAFGDDLGKQGRSRRGSRPTRRR